MNFFNRQGWGRLLLLAGVVALGLVGCGDGDEDSSDDNNNANNSNNNGGNNNGSGNYDYTLSCGDRPCKTVKIGSQTWMAENLNYMVDSSWCYNNDPTNCDMYGRMYRWATARTICPSGWHLPSIQEWEDLESAAGSKVAGKKLKSTSGWNDYNGKSGNGTDDYGFSALPGGYIFPSGAFAYIGDFGIWWTVTDYGDEKAIRRSIEYRNDGVSTYYIDKNYGFSVRCVEGNNNNGNGKDTSSGNNNNKINNCGKDGTANSCKTIKIGTQTWMAENLNRTPSSGNSWCYGDKPDSCAVYGRLYDWNTAKTVCPAGWKLPDTADWNRLVTTVGGREIAGKKLKSTYGWKNAWGEDYGNGSDSLGFSALPGGIRYTDGSFHDANLTGYWWTATENGARAAYFRDMLYLYDIVHGDNSDIASGLSVRCVKD